MSINSKYTKEERHLMRSIQLLRNRKNNIEKAINKNKRLVDLNNDNCYVQNLFQDRVDYYKRLLRNINDELKFEEKNIPSNYKPRQKKK